MVLTGAIALRFEASTQKTVDGWICWEGFQIMTNNWWHFLNNLVNNGQQDAALAYVPRERTGMADESGAMVFGQNPDGSFKLMRQMPMETCGIWFSQ